MYRPTLPAALYNDTGWFFKTEKSINSQKRTIRVITGACKSNRSTTCTYIQIERVTQTS